MHSQYITIGHFAVSSHVLRDGGPLFTRCRQVTMKKYYKALIICESSQVLTVCEAIRLNTVGLGLAEVQSLAVHPDVMPHRPSSATTGAPASGCKKKFILYTRTQTHKNASNIIFCAVAVPPQIDIYINIFK